MALYRWLHKLLSVVALLGLSLSPVQSLVRAGQPAATSPAPAAEPAMPAYTGLHRTTVTVRGPAHWARLERLGAVVLSGGAEEQRGGGAEVNCPLHLSSPAPRHKLSCWPTRSNWRRWLDCALSRRAPTNWGCW